MNSEPTPSHHTEPTYPPNPNQDDKISDAQGVNSHNSFDAIASEYGKSSRQITRAAWMKELIEGHKGWIGFEGMGSHIQALDYCAGTGLFSQALAPHVHEVIGVDDAKNMVIEYNKIASETKDDHPECEMRAVWGDIVERKEPVDEAWAADAKFDIIAMSLAINFFACLDCGDPGLQEAFETLTSRLKPNGIMLILDVEKDYEHQVASDPKIFTLRNGLKTNGLGSREVASALEGLEVEDVMVTEGKNLRLRYENVDDVEPEMAGEVYYLLKAKKGVAYRGDVQELSERQVSE